MRLVGLKRLLGQCGSQQRDGERENRRRMKMKEAEKQKLRLVGKKKLFGNDFRFANSQLGGNAEKTHLNTL